MLFRRRSRKTRALAAAGRLVPSKRVLAATAGVASSLAALTAASSGVSALRQKQS